MARIEVKIEDPGQAEEVEVVEVHVAEGATVQKGDALMELATDKANMDLEAPADGTVVSVGVAEGDAVGVDHVFAIIETA